MGADVDMEFVGFLAFVALCMAAGFVAGKTLEYEKHHPHCFCDFCKKVRADYRKIGQEPEEDK